MNGVALRFTSRAWAQGAALALGCWLVLGMLGAGWVPSAVVVIAVSWQMIGGWLTWRALRPMSSLIELAGAGLALGTAMGALAGVLVRTVGLGGWGWAIPSAIAVALEWRGRQRSAMADREPSDLRSMLGVTIGLGIALAGIVLNLRNYPLTWSGSWNRYHFDMPFFEAVATSLANFGAGTSPFLPDAQLRYHWMAYAWAGQIADVAGTAPFVSLTRVLPVVATLGLLLLTVAWSRRLSTVPWVPALAGVLLATGGFLGAVFGGVLSIDSPSQSLGALWLVAFAMLAVALLDVRGDRSRWLGLLVIGGLAFALMAGKVSAAAPALAGTLLMAVVLSLRRDPRWRIATWVAVAAALGMALAFVLVLSGASGGGGLTLGSLVDRASSMQGLNPIDGMRGAVLGTVMLLLAIALRWVGVAWLLGQHRWRREPVTWMALGLALSALVGVAAFNGLNELWFATSAAAPLSAIAAVAAGEAANSALGSRSRSWAWVAGLALSGVLAFAVTWALWSTGASGGNLFVPTLRWLGPLAGVIVSLVLAFVVVRAAGSRGLLAVLAGAVVALTVATAPGRLLGLGSDMVGTFDNGMRAEWFSFGKDAFTVRDRDLSMVDDWTSTRMSAAQWLRERAEPGDLVATNLTLGTFVSGVTGQPTYVSGLHYQAPYGSPEEATVLLRRENEVWDFIESPSGETVRPLCAEGVRWAWVDPGLTEVRSWSPFARVVFTKPDVILLEFDPTACP